jgi:hypothetical protein
MGCLDSVPLGDSTMAPSSRDIQPRRATLRHRPAPRTSATPSTALPLHESKYRLPRDAMHVLARLPDFAAMEVPDLFTDDVRNVFRLIR